MIRHSLDYSAASNSPFLKERFCNSSRHGTRPSTYSTISFLGSERSPRFYEKVVRWFRRKRGRNISNESFPAEKHSNARHNVNSPALAHRNNINRRISTSPKTPLRAQNSLSASEGSQRSIPSCLYRTVDRISPVNHPKARGLLSSTSSNCSGAATTTALASTRGISMESGYQSFSTCSSPAASVPSPSVHKRDRNTRFRFLPRAFKKKSFSVEIPEQENWQPRLNEDDVAEGKRRKFQCREAAFHSAVDEEVDSEQERSESRGSSCYSSVFSGSASSLAAADTHEQVAATLGDFRIRYSELVFETALASNPRSSIHAGKCQVWDVNIHSCCPSNDEEVRDWLADVRRLTQIRHQNIVLYMGACVEPPRFAIITGLVQREDLYTHTVVLGQRISAAHKLSILRQTANAMSYLHCRGIVHGRLSSHNIFLEKVVKVSLLDYTPALLNLQYYSPEIARTLRFQGADSRLKTKEGDVFSFGSLVYQISTQRLPLDSLPAQTVLYLVGRGLLPLQLQSTSLNPGVSRLVERCWNPTPELRPSFPALCSLLQPLCRTIGARKHSLSEPKNMDQIGRSNKPDFFNTEIQTIQI